MASAMASSIRKGQIALMCQLCENEPKMKWKCLDCGLMMCQRCRDKVHPKFASAEDHTITDIKDINEHQSEPGLKLDFTKLKCVVHNRKNTCLYCQTCNELVCRTCIAASHKKHDFCEISDEYQNRVDKIKSEQEDMNKEFQTLTIRHGKLRQVRFLTNKRYNKVKQEIADNETTLVDTFVDAVKKHTNKLSADFDRNFSAISKSVDEEEEIVEETEKKFREQNYIVDKVLRSNDVEKVFSDLLVKSMKIAIPPINIASDNIPNFIPGDISDISKLFGKLEDAKAPYDTDLRVVQQLNNTTKETAISKIIACQDGSLWINSYGSKILQKVKLEGDILKIISQFDNRVNDMTLLPSCDLLLSVPDTSNLKLVPSGSQDLKDSPYNISPLLTTGVHITANNKVVIGVRNAGSVWPATGPRQVVVLDQTGQQEKVFQYDKHNNPLFTFPHYITSNSNNNIAVIDWVSNDYRGRVVVLHLEGGVRNIYNGHPGVNNNENPFKPSGIVTTPSDNFVVTDPPNHTLHILNSEGDILTYYNTEEIGIELPWSLTFSSTGQLYIGCGNYVNSKDPAKIFVVDNFVW